MPLKFRNIDAIPDDPVSLWVFEGMLAAIDRGYARDWRKLVDALAYDPSLRTVYEEAAEAAESRSTVGLLDLALAELPQHLPSWLLNDSETRTEAPACLRHGWLVSSARHVHGSTHI